MTTILTSVTGFMFPLTRIGPPHVFGVISLAPTQSDPPFFVAHLVVLVAFVARGMRAVRRLRPT